MFPFQVLEDEKRKNEVELSVGVSGKIFVESDLAKTDIGYPGEPALREGNHFGADVDRMHLGNHRGQVLLDAPHSATDVQHDGVH